MFLGFSTSLTELQFNYDNSEVVTDVIKSS